MPGNELEICKFLYRKMGEIELRHIGIVNKLEIPASAGRVRITGLDTVQLLKTEDSRKKADIFINDIGVSLKQEGGSFSYNRLQRANLLSLYTLLKFGDIEQKLAQIDQEILRFHKGLLDRRNRPWDDFFSEIDFKTLLEFLMMKGSPNVGYSSSPAALILEAPSLGISSENIYVYTFNEYFEKYRKNFKVAIRRQWVGQASMSEHGRALGLVRKTGNAPWVFGDVKGQPHSGWKRDFPPEQRKTVYFLMIEKESQQRRKSG